MKTHKIAAAVLALTMGFSTLAVADNDRGHRDDRRGGPHGQRHDRGDHDRRDRGPDRRDHGRWDHGRGHGGPDHRFAQGRGAGPDHRWHRGDRLPPQYRGRNYVVNDWRGHRLSAPPRGYHWVQNGGDYLLVAIATGVIATLILNQ